MAIFVLLRFSYSETGPFLRPAAARRAGRPTCGTTCIESSGGAPELLPVLRGEDEHACGSSRVFRQRDTRYRRDACGAPARSGRVGEPVIRLRALASIGSSGPKSTSLLFQSGTA